MVRVFSKTVGFYLVTRVCLTSGILTTNVAANSAGQTTSPLSLAHSYLPAAATGVFPKLRQHAAYVEHSGRKPFLTPGKILTHSHGESKGPGDRHDSGVTDNRSKQAASAARFLTEINRDYARTRILGPKSSTTSRPTSEERSGPTAGGSEYKVNQDDSTVSEGTAFKLHKTRLRPNYGARTRIRPSSRSPEEEKVLKDFQAFLNKMAGSDEFKVDTLLGAKTDRDEINVGSSGSEGRKEASDRSSYRVVEDGLTTYSGLLSNFSDQGGINLDYGLRAKILRPSSRSPSEVQKDSKRSPYKVDLLEPEGLDQGQPDVRPSRSERLRETSKRSSYQIFEDPDSSISSGSGRGRPNEYGSDLKEWGEGYGGKVVGSQDITSAIKALDRFLSGVLNDERYNVVQHPPTNPVLALVLSRYGRYVPGTRNPRYYSYMAVNNIHNNRPFGKYKLETDEEPSYG